MTEKNKTDGNNPDPSKSPLPIDYGLPPYYDMWGEGLDSKNYMQPGHLGVDPNSKKKGFQTLNYL